MQSAKRNSSAHARKIVEPKRSTCVTHHPDIQLSPYSCSPALSPHQQEATSRLHEEITLLSELSKAEQRQLKVWCAVSIPLSDRSAQWHDTLHIWALWITAHSNPNAHTQKQLLVERRENALLANTHRARQNELTQSLRKAGSGVMPLLTAGGSTAKKGVVSSVTST